MQPASSLDESFSRLRRWIEDAVGDVDIGADPPAEPIGDTLVSLHLLGLRPAQNLHGGDAAGYVWFRARYLVTARAADVHAANELLERLFVAASISDGIEPRLDVLGADTWLALQTRPRPAFVVDLPVRHALEREPGSIVLFPLAVEGAGHRVVSGHVLSPSDVPIAGAVVELSGGGTRSRTDAAGAFRLPLVPVEPINKRLRVRAKGREFLVDVDLGAVDDDLIIRCDPREA